MQIFICSKSQDEVSLMGCNFTVILPVNRKTALFIDLVTMEEGENVVLI